jgi:pimeloyl-ACP methyl ester carboxylesterase
MTASASALKGRSASAAATIPVTHHRTAKIDGMNIFYREAGPKDAPAVVLLHGFPTSSHMFRNLIPALANGYRVIAPDYPGYGQSDMPDRSKFAYTFDRFSELVDGLLDHIGITRYAVYVMDYGYEWHDDSGNWFRSYGNENWEFAENGLMRRRIASINDLPIAERDRKFRWPLGRRPDDHPSLGDLGL